MTATERDYESTVIEAARLGGWLVHAERPARSNRGWRTPIRGDAGWPDLILVGHGRVIVVELKTKHGKVTLEQQRWLDTLTKCGIDTRVAWMPDDLDSLVAELVSGRDPLATPCPVCDAQAGEVCRTPQDYPMPRPHHRRAAAAHRHPTPKGPTP